MVSLDESQLLLPGRPLSEPRKDSNGVHKFLRGQEESLKALSQYLPDNNFRSIIYIYVIYFFSNFAGVLLDVPTIRLFERAVCAKWYRSHAPHDLNDIDERFCKISPVQSEVAFLVGWRVSFDALPGLWPPVCLRCPIVH
jgi:hypothetical protein